MQFVFCFLKKSELLMLHKDVRYNEFFLICPSIVILEQTNKMSEKKENYNIKRYILCYK